MKSTLVVVAIALLVSTTISVAIKSTVTVRKVGVDKEAQTLGELGYDVKSGLTTANIEISNQDLYSSILRDSDAVYQFEFKPAGNKASALKTSLKIPKKASALGFQVYSSSRDFVNSINVVTDPKIKQPFSRIIRSETASIAASSADHYASDVASTIDNDDFDIPVGESEKIGQKGTSVETEKEKAEKKKPWYKEYFWYIIIAGFFVYRIATMDKTAFKEQVEQAQQKAEGLKAQAQQSANQKR